MKYSKMTVEQTEEAEQATIASLPEIAAASPVGYLPLRVAESQRLGTGDLAPPNVVCVGFEPAEFLEMNRLDWIEGTAEAAIPRLEEGDAVLVAKEFLVARDLGVGDSIALGAEGDRLAGGSVCTRGAPLLYRT